MLSSTLQSPLLIIGVAHVIDVEAPLRRALDGRPLDGVALELDPERAEQVLRPSGSRPSGEGAPILLRLWGRLQRRLGDQLGVGAGGEMRAAAAIAHERQLPIFLIDDPIRLTIGRLLGALSFRERISLLVGGLIGIVVPARVVEGQLQEYTESPTEYLEAVRSAYPAVARVLLDERNDHMAERLGEIRAQGYGRVVAVVGDAHLPGLSEALKRRGIPVESIPFAALRSTAS